MTIYDYFKEYDNKYYKMKDKLVELKDAERNFYTLTGTKPSEMPKTSSTKIFDFSDQMIRIEKIFEDYKKLESDYLKEKEKCLNDINKISNPKYRTIIRLSFIDKKKIKAIASVLGKIYKLDYTIDYIKNIKSKAIKEFEKKVTKNY